MCYIVPAVYILYLSLTYFGYLDDWSVLKKQAFT